MKYIDEYKDKEICLNLIENIKKTANNQPMTFMEVCGTHTMSIHRFGIKQLLPENIKLLSGPGCPVCVTDQETIDRIIAYSEIEDFIIATFGDMFRVPGTTTSLSAQKAKGKDIRIIYSPIDALKIARENPSKKILMAGIGFETTAPLFAATILQAYDENITNIYLISAFKLIEPALRLLLETEELNLSALILPGHLSVITGFKIYDFMVSDYKIGGVVTGFEPIDILQGIYMLTKQITEKIPRIENQYKRCVREEGNKKAQQMIKEVFKPCDSKWRGIGLIPGSGLKLNGKFEKFDINKVLPIVLPDPVENTGCICGLILRGLKKPTDCPLFKNICTPINPIGACMVSSEGTCAAFYKYGN